jgi:hypothetical protein
MAQKRLNLGANAEMYSGQPASSAYRGNPYLSVKKSNKDDKHEFQYPIESVTNEDY